MKKLFIINFIIPFFGLYYGCSSIKNTSIIESPQNNISAVIKETKKVMLMNRIGPSVSELFIANTDGTNEHKLFEKSGFDYHASFSSDRKWIVFTSERNGLGQADIYRVHPDGTIDRDYERDP